MQRRLNPRARGLAAALIASIGLLAACRSPCTDLQEERLACPFVLDAGDAESCQERAAECELQVALIWPEDYCTVVSGAFDPDLPRSLCPQTGSTRDMGLVRVLCELEACAEKAGAPEGEAGSAGDSPGPGGGGSVESCIEGFEACDDR